MGKALTLLRRAAECGHPEAQAELGAAYLSGKGVEQSYDTAATWFRRGSLNGNALAQCNLGALYAQGLGALSQDFTEALRWYKASAEGGNLDGQHNLALMYAHGLGGLEQNYQMAREWCEQAASHGHPKARAMLDVLPGAAEPTIPACSSPNASDERKENDLVTAVVGEAQALLAEVRAQNAKNEDACEFLDALLAKVGDLKRVMQSSTGGNPLTAAKDQAQHAGAARTFDTMDFTVVD